MENLNKENTQLQLAHDFVQYTGKHIFLTGKAGTGKTTFLKNLREQSPKRMIVVAPTGVAAINAGGVTIHSFFQLPFGPIVQGYSKRNEGSFVRFSREKRNIIKSLDLLVIDEISMVRADLLDGIDEVLRRFRRNKEPFGGVQMLMIGDMQQLPPVVREQDWNLLRKHYQTAYFFGSLALQKADYVTITLEHVYRQQDQKFLNILNKIRDKRIDNDLITQLKDRYLPDFQDLQENYITLTTHNAKARQINQAKLNELESERELFFARVGGNFPEYNFPTEQELELKVGAQVMFVKNDPEAEKRFFNGKIGRLESISSNEVVVVCPEDDEPIVVKPLEWQNVKYTIDEGSKEIKEEIEGSFTQIPLKLAWAITIHKSQGLTFDRVIIDSQKAFAHGQVYVALSRCRTLEGMVLTTPFSPASLKVDNAIEDFNNRALRKQPTLKELEISRAEFQQLLLLDLFDFARLQKEIIWFTRALSENKRSLTTNDPGPVEKMSGSFRTEIVEVSDKFRTQILEHLQENNDAEENSALQNRIKKAVPYFSGKLNQIVLDPIHGLNVETDNKEVRKTISKAEERLVGEVELKIASLVACKDGFDVKHFMIEKAKAAIEAPAKKRSRKTTKKPVSAEIKNPMLYELIKNWRNAKSEDLDISVFMALPLKTMRALSAQVPSTIAELKLVHGFGKKKIEQFGEEILELLNDFRKEHDVVVEALSASKKKSLNVTPKKNTKEVSLELWENYKDIEKVAKERGMVQSTIEGHLAHYVGNGELAVADFVKEAKIFEITSFLESHEDLSLGEVKGQLGEHITYSDLRFVRQHLNYQRSFYGKKSLDEL